MSVRNDLLAAIDAGDHLVIRRSPFAAVWESLATSNAPRQSCTLNELRPYVALLGNEDPGDVLEALEACAGSFRPVAGEIKGYLNRMRGDSTRVDVGRASDPAGTPEAIAAVADALRAGEQVCACGGPTARKWNLDGLGVLRCPEGHLEQGQAYAAEDAGLIEVAA